VGLRGFAFIGKPPIRFPLLSGVCPHRVGPFVRHLCEVDVEYCAVQSTKLACIERRLVKSSQTAGKKLKLSMARNKSTVTDLLQETTADQTHRLLATVLILFSTRKLILVDFTPLARLLFRITFLGKVSRVRGVNRDLLLVWSSKR
jgi:hypothetical protein